VLANSCLDDGRGIARSLVLKHRHEKDNGRTSAVTLEIMGFKGDEQVLPTSRNHIQRWTEVATNSTRTVTLIDLCGHEKYLKTTLFGLTGLLPDFGFLIVGSNMGVQVMTKEHISIACALNLPLFVAVTKVDMCPPNILQNTKRTLAKILRSCGRMPFPVKDMSAVDTAIDNITHMYDRVTPVFTISCVSGQGIDLLRSFISKLRRNEKRYYEEIDRNDNDVVYDSHVPDTYYQIDSVYEVKGVGIIVGGTIRRGIIRLNDNNNLYIGPDRNGIFHHINIRSMECRHVPITEAKIGQCITLAIKSVNRKVTLQRSWFRRGMVIMDSNTIHNATTSIPRGIDVNMPRAVR
jgi:GTPase